MKSIRHFSILALISVFGGLLVSCHKKKECTLSAPEHLVASSNSSIKIELDWEGSEDANSFAIYRSRINEMGEAGDFHEVGHCRGHHYEDLEVNSSCEYQYRVEARCENGGFEMSETVNAATMAISVVEAFEELGSATGGEATNCSSASELPGTINEVIDNHLDPGTDLVFLIDNTGSMYDDINYVKMQLNTIIANLPPNTRVGMAYYKDNNVDNPWYASSPLDMNTTNVTSFLNSMYAGGGGDTPESVYDGLYKTISEMEWRDRVNRAVIVIGDAPPLDGGLSHHTLAEVLELCNSNGVVTNVFPILTSVSTVSPFRSTGATSIQFQSNQH